MTHSLDASSVASGTPRETRLADYRPPAFLVDTVDLTFELDDTDTRVASRLTVRRNLTGDPSAPLRLDGGALDLLSVTLDGAPLGANRYRIEDNQLVIPDLPDHGTLEIETRIAPKDNTRLTGLHVSNGGFFTQCEAEGFRRITYFPDRPDVMARFTATIIADAARYPVLLSNGNPQGTTTLADGRHCAVWVDPHPKPCYLFALVAGDLVSVTDRFVTRSGREVALAIWVRRGDEDRCGHAMRSLKQAMTWDEETFGREYDLDVYNIAAASDFSMGAMENKGLNVFNNKFVLARPETATDADYQGIETVIAHEYFHNWTGNRVTGRDWFQLSLKEGLTVYRDQEFTADQGSRAVKRIQDVRALRATQFAEDAGPLAHPVQPDRYIAIGNFYTATVYTKGAEVIRMIATIIGRPAFRRGMDLYFARYDNHAVTIDDFVQAMQDASGVDLTRFKRWYHQAGTPELDVADEYDQATQRWTLVLRQTTRPTPGQPEKQPLVIPVALGLLDDQGRALPTRLAGEAAALDGTRIVLAAQAETRFVFEDVPSLPTPSLLRGFSAPVKLFGVSPERLRLLAAHDSDPFVRWESGQQYAAVRLLEMAAAWRSGATRPPVDPGVIEAASATLATAEADPAFAAEALMLPSESFLADVMTIVDVDAIHAVRDQARVAIGAAIHPALRATYERLTDPGPYRIEALAIGGRALRNACLGYLAADGGTEGVALAKAQFDAGQNMTDVLAALAVLAAVDCPERLAALDAFYAAWRGDDLVLDKWFAIQATSSLPDTPAAVRALARRSDFSLQNPSRVRALVGSFAAGNPVRFHDASGAGYGLLADTVIALDPSNAHVAARLVAPLGQWRRMDPTRQMLMRAELDRILAVPSLSKGTYEMASKSLA